MTRARLLSTKWHHYANRLFGVELGLFLFLLFMVFAVLGRESWKGQRSEESWKGQRFLLLIPGAVDCGIHDAQKASVERSGNSASLPLFIMGLLV